MRSIIIFINIIVDIIADTFHSFTYFVKDNIRKIPTLVNLVVPYIMYYLGMNQEYDIGWLFIPIVGFVFIYFTREFANKIGKGTDIPIPSKRFTSVDSDGEVSIENDRLQELILYIGTLEDWMERKNLL